MELEIENQDTVDCHLAVVTPWSLIKLRMCLMIG